MSTQMQSALKPWAGKVWPLSIAVLAALALLWALFGGESLEKVGESA